MVSARVRWRVLRDLEQWLDGPMVILSLLWLAIVVWELVSGTSALLGTVGTLIWVVFIAEFLLRFTLAPDKWPFLKSNWLTIVALAVPALRLLRAFAFLRAARGLRGLRLVRIVGTANRSMNALRRTLARRGFGYVAGMTLLVIGLGAGGMLSFEPAGEVSGGFRDYWEALWWTAMLVTSIGSEYWPQTVEGRVLTLLLSLYGLGVLGYITATLASFFIGRDAQSRDRPAVARKDVSRLADEVRALRLSLGERSAAPQ